MKREIVLRMLILPQNVAIALPGDICLGWRSAIPGSTSLGPLSFNTYQEKSRPGLLFSLTISGENAIIDRARSNISAEQHNALDSGTSKGT